MATMMIRIPDLVGGDAEKLEAVLRALPGVFGVVVSTSEGCAEVDIEDDEVDYDQVLERVRSAGFDATLSG
jgi:copper chaperone CopZ